MCAHRAVLAIAVACLVAMALAPPAAASKGIGSTGPYAGVVVQGQTNVHAYATPGPPIYCILPVWYTVTLRYAPASDTLTLSANGVSITGGNGAAQVSFEAACWTQFAITVTGTAVATVAAYEVTVSGGGAAPSASTPPSITASAADPSSGRVDVGPCWVAWSMFWPGDHTTASCWADGHEAVYASSGSTYWGGRSCQVRVLDGAVARDPCRDW